MTEAVQLFRKELPVGCRSLCVGIGVERGSELAFRHVSTTLAIDREQRACRELGVQWDCKRLSGSVCRYAAKLRVASPCRYDAKAFAVEKPNDVIPAEPAGFRH